MKNRTIFFALAFVALIIAFSACEKEEKNNTLDLLVNNVWVYDSLTVSDEESEGLVIAAAFLHYGFNDCEFDFSSDGSYTVNSELINNAGVWELSGNSLILDKGTEDEMEMEILSLNDETGEFKVPLEGDFFTIPFNGYATLIFNSK
ncbi:MAG: hypothetical protein JXB00_04055 [Bacteroidales bacterium]|nr:hypothetical protein [Bacteroidales bacterium]